MEKAAPATVNRYLEFLKHLFNVAIADKKAEENPFLSVKLFKENNRRVRYLTTEEEGSLRQALGENRWPTVAFAMHAGLRQAEQFNLRWENIDFTTGHITIPLSKSGELRRVPMNDTARAILRDMPSRLQSQFVFPSKTGETPLNAANYRNRVFLPAVRQAGIKDFRWHDLAPQHRDGPTLRAPVSRAPTSRR